ncbi:RHS repeat-associated core domain-containing protein [Algibacter sp. TI.3.09]|uniref:RHS repeat-associated core domain-containing protein n=1 Tax=Algibacter sp. TI.3.09 TaxID=3121298 RepID=UPI00311E6E07
MKIKNYFIIILLFLVSFIGYAQTPNSLLEDPSNIIKLDFEKITTKKNSKAKSSTPLSQSLQLKSSGKLVTKSPIEREEPCLIDPESGNCVNELPPLEPFPPCLDCDGICDPRTGECIEPSDPCPDCDGICDPRTGECIESVDPPGGGTDSSGTAGTTPGVFNVSLSGAATYNIPINLPPGIKDIAPNISLEFSSQAANGLAGWGWNISGLSTITRIPSTQYHDGIIDGVDFDSYDRFTLDGQRLLSKSGTYGAANSEYQTENYSNLKVKAYGTNPYGASYGPSYFIVFYPDGTRAYYGNAGSSRGRLEWALYKREDPQGNYIQYDYSQSNGLLRINTIKYGARASGSSPNELKFYYKTRTRPELSYINGYTFKKANILDRIEVKGGGQLYRKYQLSHNTTSLGYQRISSIKEYNSANQSFPGISFSYDSSSSGVSRDGNTLSIYPGIDYKNDAMVSGEFDGDGKMDIITYNKDSRDKLNVFMDMFGNQSSSIGYSVNTDKFDGVFASTILSWNGKVLQQQGVTIASETINSSNSTVRFRTFAMASYGAVFQYDKSVNFSIGPASIGVGASNCSSLEDRKIDKTYINGDFNGDGLTDVIAIPKKYYKKYYSSRWNCNSFDANVSQENSEVYFIDLKRTASTTAVDIGTLTSRIEDDTDKLYGVDFDGDGKTDLIHVRDGSVRVYSMNSSNQLVQIAYLSNSNIDIDKPIVLGDYNGDGKIDFTIPSGNNSSTWYFYLSKGNSIYYYSKNIGVTYTKTYVHDGGRNVNGVYMSNPYYEYHYISQDYNADGKSDILKHEVVSPYSSYNVVSDRLMLYANKQNSTESTPSFSLVTNSLATNNGITKFGIPVFLEAKGINRNLEYAYIDGNNVHTYEFNQDHKRDVSLKQITNDGLETDIFYETLNSKYGSDIYSFDYNENYPYVNVNIAPALRVVKEAQNNGSGHTQRQLYHYNGAVTHAQGLGFLGFKTVKKTNWFGDGVGGLWSISKHNMQKRGAITQQWISTSESNTPSSFINKTDYTYFTQLLSNKVFINIPTKTITVDGLHGVTSTENYTYDSYKNPLTISKIYPGGSKITTYQYINNPSSTSHTYHIGRPTKKTEVSVLSGNSFSTEKQITYINNLVSQTKSKGNGTSWLTEKFSYNAYGNVISKTISGEDVNRKEEYEYDTSNRFMLKSIDILGLETNYTYDAETGMLLTSTSPYGQTTTFTYDAWQRLLKETNYLGKEINYAYNKENVSGIGWCLTKNIDYAEGQDTKSYTNVFGWVVQNKVLSLNNKWIQKKYEYDAAGRKVRESEPYFSTESPSQWNHMYFDQYGRPISNTLYTGKIINVTYNGLSSAIDDGTKIVTTTKDALGNTVTLQDPGGAVNYEYYVNGVMKSANYGSHKVSITIDGWGRKASLTDPSAGIYTYEYNILGEILKESTPKGFTQNIYDDYGRITDKKIFGDNTDTTSKYEYSPTSKLLEKISSTAQGRPYIYNYGYDNYKRLNNVKESNGGSANFEKSIIYDDFGRVFSDTYTSSRNGVSSSVKVKNIYDNAGIHEEVRDFNSNELLWKINDENARGQALNIQLGNGLTKFKQYNQYGFLTNITDKDNSTAGTQALKIDYDFDVKRNILNSRINHAFGGWEENFTHDNLNRLTNISGAVNHVQDYDDKGRITNNSFVGDYNYNNTTTYRVDDIDLNSQGDLYYQQHSLQQITYNAYKKPVEIHEKDKGRITFEYGPMQNRTVAIYGGDHADKYERRYRKIYSSIMPVEIVDDTETNAVKIITYIGGDAYTAPITYIKQSGSESIDGYHYLHRDYLGSILAITDAGGLVKEQRQFGAWGLSDKFADSKGNTIFTHGSLLGRGFTGHEHFFEVSLIHMNGRMYDAQLGRFLSPDNNIQEPFNTQNFNRYGYVLNNPLSFNDPTGESFNKWWKKNWKQVVTVAAVVVVTVAVTVLTAGTATPLLVGVMAGAAGGFTGGALGTALNGGSFGESLLNGGIGAFTGALMGGAGAYAASFAPAGILNGALYGSTSNAILGGIGDLLMGGDGIQGALWGGALGLITGGYTGYVKANAIGGNIWNGKVSNPVTTPMSDAQLIARAAEKSQAAIEGTDRFAGTAKHTYANKLLDRYQGLYGDRGFEFNSYFNNGVGNRGFLDVINHSTNTIYDFKFGVSGWSPGQFLKYQRNFPGYTIEMVRP